MIPHFHDFFKFNFWRDFMHIQDKLQKPAKNYIRKIREIEWSYLCLQQFDKLWMGSA
jgi:hypothetical protein